MVKEQNWLRDEIFSGSRGLGIGIFNFELGRKFRKSRESGSGFESFEKISSAKYTKNSECKILKIPKNTTSENSEKSGEKINPFSFKLGKRA